MPRVISEPSLPFSPVISGTACCRPARYIASGSSGMTQPSTLGAQTLPVRMNGLPASALDAASTSAALAARMAASASSVFPAIPSAAATRRPCDSAASQPRAASASGRSQPLIQLLWAMAPWNSPSACGTSMTDMTAPPPADSPKIVTRPGSPPNVAMLSRTHSSAATMSSRP